MKLALCDKLGIEFPLFAFSHCRDVIAVVTNAGGMGVLSGSTLVTVTWHPREAAFRLLPRTSPVRQSRRADCACVLPSTWGL